MFECLSQVRTGVSVPVLQLWTRAEIQTGHLQGLPRGDHARLWERSVTHNFWLNKYFKKTCKVLTLHITNHQCLGCFFLLVKFTYSWLWCKRISQPPPLHDCHVCISVFKCLHQMSITKTNSECISWSFSHVLCFFFFYSTCWCFLGVYVGQLYGLEKFWAFLKYAKVKNQPIDPKLQEYLSKFKSIDDFRVDVSIGISFDVNVIPCQLCKGK